MAGAGFLRYRVGKELAGTGSGAAGLPVWLLPGAAAVLPAAGAGNVPVRLFRLLSFGRWNGL